MDSQPLFNMDHFEDHKLLYALVETSEQAAFNGDPGLLSDFINIAPEEQAASYTTKEPAIQKTGKKVLKKRCDSKEGEILHATSKEPEIQGPVKTACIVKKGTASTSNSTVVRETAQKGSVVSKKRSAALGSDSEEDNISALAKKRHKTFRIGGGSEEEEDDEILETNTLNPTNVLPGLQETKHAQGKVRKDLKLGERFPHGGPGGLHPNDFPPGMPRGDFSAGMSRDDIPGMHPDAFPRRRYPDCPGRRYPNEFPSGSFREGSPLRVRGERMRPEMSDFDPGGNQAYKRTPEGSSTCSPVFEILENFRIETEGDAQMVLKITQKLTDILMEYRLRSFATVHPDILMNSHQLPGTHQGGAETESLF
ncbi:hypothetical protein EOD39_13132 [Acipenser ruthenus]|uniref:Uncharacterized protein n=1 Tax=Acipenser ruthenus TaxID=7906 RepID=A0A444UJI1_ACIRT|nr:hypothetical protein EOD39_13132 [Acipenser ruthenus]